MSSTYVQCNNCGTLLCFSLDLSQSEMTSFPLGSKLNPYVIPDDVDTDKDELSYSPIYSPISINSDNDDSDDYLG